MAQAKNAFDIERFGGGDYLQYLHAAQLPKWRGVVAAFDEIATLAREQKCPVLLLIFPATTTHPWAQYPYRSVHQQVAAAAKRAGFHVIDLYEIFSRYRPEDLMVDPEDGHPSRRGHQLAANAIHQWMVANRELVGFPRPQYVMPRSAIFLSSIAFW